MKLKRKGRRKNNRSLKIKLGEWIQPSRLVLLDKKVFFGKRESKTVLKETLSTLTTTTGKQCNENRGMELANHLLKILVSPTLEVSNRCKP